MIAAENLVKSFPVGGEHGTTVLKGVSLKIEEATMCTILGPSGSGKSTLLNCLSGLEGIDSGTVTVADRDVHSLSRREVDRFRRDEIAFVFQEYNLVGDLTLHENIVLDRPLVPKVDELIDGWNLRGVVDGFPGECSGGQRQKCAILRALNKECAILFCDEPTGALDTVSTREVFSVLQDLTLRFGVTIVMITHNELVTGISHQVVRLHDGRVVSDDRGLAPVDASSVAW
ncbi:ABC transporter ATP-binding protein [Nocardiopsis akebiae]|uniref:ABC transporter ATP-binding protein n=1 Tax=Nocardiopsis akebiae TaxID=2831968 RepID=A0ABX8C0L7_9ACTN|nr:ABC transporter ATP-binding protein [Nocardiopsis akebiae]QUX27858.1 ABC transporter ATP-binding protein [Nocardiopsis akebiae]